MIDKETIFQERIELIMKYVDTNDVPTKGCPLRFIDVDPNYRGVHSETKIVNWLAAQLYENLEKLQIEIEKYHDIYHNGYLKIKERLVLKENRLSSSNKMKLLLRYLNNDGVEIPAYGNPIRFCDIDHFCHDTTNVATWIQTTLASRNDWFIGLYPIFKDIYPIAYQKIDFKIKSRNREYINEYRISTLVSFLEEYHLTNNECFCDIGGNISDKRNVLNWIYSQMRTNSSFLEIIKQYCEKHYIDFQKIYSNMKSNKQNRKYSLKENRRTILFLSYLEKHPFVSREDKVRFCDIDSSIDDNVFVGIWFFRNYAVFGDKYLEEFTYLKDVYPKGYRKLWNRINKYTERKSTSSISFDDKLISLLKYLEEHDIPKRHEEVTFHDLDSNYQSNSLVNTWFINETSYRLPRLVAKLSQYQDIYPIGYQKIADKINGSQARVQKERLLLLDELKKIRNNMLIQESSSLIKGRKLN